MKQSFPEIERILFTDEQVQQRIAEVGAGDLREISRPRTETDWSAQGLRFFSHRPGARHRDPCTDRFSLHFQFLHQDHRAGTGSDREGPRRKHRRGRCSAGRGHRRYRVYRPLPAADPGCARPQFARRLYPARSDLAPHRANSHRIPLLRNSGPFRYRVRVWIITSSIATSGASRSCGCRNCRRIRQQY